MQSLVFAIRRGSICFQVKNPGCRFASMVAHSIAAVLAWIITGSGVEAQVGFTGNRREFTGRVNGLDEKVDSPGVAAANIAGDNCAKRKQMTIMRQNNWTCIRYF